MQINDEDIPVMYSGDDKNRNPGPMACPFAIYQFPNGKSFQVTFSRPSESNPEVTIVSTFEYDTPECRKHLSSKPTAPRSEES